MEWIGILAILALGVILGSVWAVLLFALILARQFGFPFIVGLKACAGYVSGLIAAAIRSYPPDPRKE